MTRVFSAVSVRALRTMFALYDGDGRGIYRCSTDQSLRPEMRQLVAQANSDCWISPAILRFGT
jgi:hypothetical protein